MFPGVAQPFDATLGRLADGLRPAYTNKMNALIAETRRMALSQERSPASMGTCVAYFLRLRSGALYISASEALSSASIITFPDKVQTHRW
jgi:hypothetical protein